MAVLEHLDVILGAKTQQFDRGMNGANKKTKSFSDSVQRSTKLLGGATTAILGFGGAALSIGGAVAMFRGFADEMDRIAKTSRKLGIATGELTALHFAAEETGVSVETFNMALQRSTRRIAEAAQGTGEARGAIRELGLDAKALAALSPDEQLRDIADAMNRVENQGDRVRLAMKLFDSEGVALVETLSLGRAGLDAMEDEAKRLGITVGEDVTSAYEKWNDASHKLALSTKRGLVPAMSDLADVLADVVNKWTGYTEEQERQNRMLGTPTRADIVKSGMETEIAAIQALIKANDSLEQSHQFGAKSRKELPRIRAEGEALRAELAKLQTEQKKANGTFDNKLPVISTGFRGATAGGVALGGVGVGLASGANAIGTAIGNRIAPFMKTYEQSILFGVNRLPEALEGAAAIDQANRNREAKSILDPQLKVQEQTKMAAEATVDILRQVQELIEDRLQGVEGVD